MRQSPCVAPRLPCAAAPRLNGHVVVLPPSLVGGPSSAAPIRVDQVAEQHRELAAFGVWERRERGNSGSGARSGGHRSPTGPNQDSAILVHGQFLA
jgi:hypothetical protein